MLKRLSLSLLIIFSSCAQINPKKPLPKFQEAPLPVIESASLSIPNGKIIFHRMEVPLPDGLYEMNCGKDKHKFQVRNAIAQLYFAADYYLEAGKVTCLLPDGRKMLDVQITDFPYKEERLRVSKKKVVLSKQAQQRVEKEWLLTQELYKKSQPRYLFNKPFTKPLSSKITSDFGKRRVFNDLKKTSHLGTDFRAAVGVPIPSANSGLVVFVGNLFYTGNVVIIDHGMDIFSLYAHLSKTKVKVGEKVHQGQIVGLAGKTGRVSGPHLHWGVKVSGKAIDGFSIIEASQKHFQSL